MFCFGTTTLTMKISLSLSVNYLKKKNGLLFSYNKSYDYRVFASGNEKSKPTNVAQRNNYLYSFFKSQLRKYIILSLTKFSVLLQMKFTLLKKDVSTKS